jgi:hypothetical protein
MAETVANAIADTRRIYPDFPADSTLQVRFANIIHRNLVEEFRLATTTADLTLDGIAREFTLNEDHVAVWSADYLTSATATPIPLEPISYDELDVNSPGWRNSIERIPAAFYEWQGATGAAVIGFDSIPPTATSGSYPTVRMIVSVYTALTSGGNLPAVIRDNTPYVMGMAYQWALKRHSDDVPLRRALYEDAKNELGAYRMRRQRRNPPTLAPAIRGLGGRSY